MITAATTASNFELLMLASLTLAVLVIPGFTVSFALTRRPGLSAAAAVPVTAGIVGFCGWAFDGLGIKATEPTFLIGWLVTLVLALLLGAIFFRSREAEGPHTRRGWGPTLAGAGTVGGLVVGATTLICRQIITYGDRGLRSIPQGWDMHWHASLVQWVHSTGIISPARTGELRYAEDPVDVYYPTGWHATCDFTTELAWRIMGRPWETTEAINLFMALSISLAAAAPAAALAWIAARRVITKAGTAASALRWSVATTAALAGLLLPAWHLMYFDGSWPVSFGIGLGGLAVAVAIQAAVAPTGGVAASIVAALAILGAAETHASMAPLLVIGLGAWLIQQLICPTPGARRLRIIGRLALAAVITAAAFYPQLRVGLGMVEEVAGYIQQEEAEPGESFLRAVFMETKSFYEYEDPKLWYVLIIVGLAGLLIAAFRGGAWLTAVGVIAIVGTAHCLSPIDGWVGTVIEPLASLNYNASHRIALMTAQAVAAGAALAALYLIFAPLARRVNWRNSRFASAAVLVSTLIFTELWSPALVNAELPGLTFLTAKGDKQGRMISSADLRAFEWLSEQVEDTDTKFSILSVPETGMGWGYATENLPMIYTHYLVDRNDEDELDTNTVLYQADQITGDLDDSVDAAACRMGIRYLIDSAAMFWGLDPYPSFYNLHEAPGLSEVYQEHDEVRVFEVDSWDPERCPSVR